MTTNLLFTFFSVFTLASAALVVVNRNAVNAAMCLLLSLVGLAGLFVQLGAGFLAFVLLLVYAGAVVTLFLFIVMLLNTRGSTQPLRPLAIASGVIAAALLGLGVWSLCTHAVPGDVLANPEAPSLKTYAGLLFTQYLLPLQVVGFLLLIAMLGVIVLSKKFADPEASS